MARGPMTLAGRLSFTNKLRARRGLGPLTMEQLNGMSKTAPSNGHTDNLDKPVDQFIPGQFRAGYGHQMLPTEVKFHVGRTVEDWTHFLGMWKTNFPNFRLDHAQTLEEVDQTVSVVLSPTPGKEK